MILSFFKFCNTDGELVESNVIQFEKRKSEILEATKMALRQVKVNYSNGAIIPTSMAANLTDAEIRNYFKIGRQFNIGSVSDVMATVVAVEIIN